MDYRFCRRLFSRTRVAQSIVYNIRRRTFARKGFYPACGMGRVGRNVPDAKEPLTFQAVGQTQPLTLVPLYKVIQGRYAAYWRVGKKST
jgi:hypothetical protein